MTVAELIEALAALPQDALVVMSGDSEGNNYSPLSELSDERYMAETTWSGVVLNSRLDQLDGVPAVVFWPTN